MSASGYIQPVEHSFADNNDQKQSSNKCLSIDDYHIDKPSQVTHDESGDRLQPLESDELANGCLHVVKLSSACDKNYQPLKHSTDYVYDDLINSTDYVQTYDLVYDEIAHNEHELSNFNRCKSE